MVLNGLRFVERRLYPEFFSVIAVDWLLGDGITPEYLNDDVLGRTLDTIDVDTTAFSVSGEYKSCRFLVDIR